MTSERLSGDPRPTSQVRDACLEICIRFSEAVEKGAKLAGGKIARVDAEDAVAAHRAARDEPVSFQASERALHDDQRSLQRSRQLPRIALL
jgi:hypothetical protein